MIYESTMYIIGLEIKSPSSFTPQMSVWPPTVLLSIVNCLFCNHNGLNGLSRLRNMYIERCTFRLTSCLKLLNVETVLVNPKGQHYTCRGVTHGNRAPREMERFYF